MTEKAPPEGLRILGVRLVATNGEIRDLSLTPVNPDGEDTEVELAQRTDDTGVHYQLQVSIDRPDFYLSAKVQSSFAADDNSIWAETEYVEWFASNIAVMVVWPYIRASIHQQAAAMELSPPVLGMVTPGAFQLHADEPEPT